MMRTQAIAGRLQEVLLNGTWIANTNFKQQLAGITLQQAQYKVQDLNTIALLTFHVCYYAKGVLQVIQGGPLEIRDAYSFNLPELQGEEDWQQLKLDFLNTAEALVQAVTTMSDESLDAVFVNEEYGSYQRNLEALIEHSYYHLGQISLLKKLVPPAT